MSKLKQLFCRHIWTDVTTEPNDKAGVNHWECYKCRKLISCWFFGEYEVRVTAALSPQKRPRKTKGNDAKS